MKKQFFFFIIVAAIGLLSFDSSFGQYKEYKINAKGDTINAINQEGKKVGKWVYVVGEQRGEPGYVEEGMYKKGEKDGYWRKYTTIGDLISLEHFLMGGKDGLQQYYTYIGDLEHEEMWRGYNPDDPYDTVPVYGTGSGEIIDFKIVKVEPYAVKEGTWRYYDPGSGRVIREEKWSNNNLISPKSKNEVTLTPPPYVKPDKPEKPKDAQKWDESRKGRRRAIKDGSTSL